MMASIDTSSTLENNKNVQFNEKSSDMKRLMRSHSIYDKYEMDWHKKFSRYGILDPYNTLTGTREYIFITKPDLYILESNGALNSSLKENSFFVKANQNYPNVIRQLQSSYSAVSDGPFMAMLSNAVSSSLEVPGISAETIETAGNITGTRITYRGTSIKSDQDYDFTLEFEDTKYLDIYMLFKVYDEYEKLKWKNGIDFTKNERWQNYIINKVLHDQVTMYKFVVADDGSRLVYWARITGCFPTTIPREAFSDMKDSIQQKITVGWKGNFVRDMDPVILYQFNKIVADYVKGKKELPLFDMTNHTINSDWASMPYIQILKQNSTSRKENGREEYYLKWTQ